MGRDFSTSQWRSGQHNLLSRNKLSLGPVEPVEQETSTTQLPQYIKLEDMTRRLSQVNIVPASSQEVDRAMTSNIRKEVFNAIGEAFGRVKYAIVGAAALADYGQQRRTYGVTIIVPEPVLMVVENKLLSHGMVRTARKGLGYRASDNIIYEINITSDRGTKQTFPRSGYAQRSADSGACVATMSFLLNFKAFTWMRRKGFGMRRDQRNDLDDMTFIAEYMRRHKIQARQEECPWATNFNFWTQCVESRKGMAQSLQALGLQPDINVTY